MAVNIHNPNTGGKDALWCQVWSEPQLRSNTLLQRRKRRGKGREGRRNKSNTLTQMLSLEATEAILGLLISLDRLVPSWRLKKGSQPCASASATLPASAAPVRLTLGAMLAELRSASWTFLFYLPKFDKHFPWLLWVWAPNYRSTLCSCLCRRVKSLLHTSFPIPCSQYLF